MQSNKRVVIASDHAGVELKSQLKKLLPEIEWEDLGAFSTDQVDYPDLAEQVGEKINQPEVSAGILICGSGVGMSIAANKIPGVRAALADNPVIARLSRQHNHANVLCLGSRFIAPEYGVEIARTWLETPYDESPRHVRRIEKIRQLEECTSPNRRR